MQITRIQRLLSTIFLLAAVLIIANAALAFHAEQVLAESERWVTHTLEVIGGLERAMRTAFDAESSARGYVLTGDRSYLGGYRYAVDTLASQFQVLEDMTRDSASETARMRLAAQLAKQKMDRLRQGVAIGHSREAVSGAEETNRQVGRAIMSRLNDTVQDAEGEERRLLAVRLRDSAHARTEARITTALASGLDVLFIIFSLWSLGYERRLRSREAEVALRLQKLQSVTEVAFTNLSADELTGELLRRLRGTAQTDVLAMFRWHETEIELIAAEGITVHPGERRRVSPDGPLAQAARTHEMVRLSGQEVKRLPIEAMHAGLETVLVLPMSAGRRVMGMLVAGREFERSFNASDEELLALAADRIALALDRAAAYDAEREARYAAERSAAEVQELNEVLEERVQQRTAELESTNRELEAFSYSVSHDLRAPLRSVDGFSVALAEDYGHLLEGDGQHYLTRIRAGVQRMGQLIDSLLQLSRITRAEISTEPVDLSNLAEQVAAEVAQANPGREIAFGIEPGLHAEGDPRLLRVVFENIFGNAAKFTAKVSSARIEFGRSPEQKSYYVRDNGAGFDPQYAGKLFVAFQRLHGDKDFQGSGIGLATVARVIARHHGKIWAEAEVGRGATFWFTLG